MKPQSLEIVYIDAVAELPTEHFAEIGRAIVWNSYLEAHLSQVIQIILDIGEVESRIATREPKSTARLEIIEDLLSHKGIPVSADFKKLWKRLDDIQIARNLLAHGCWAKHPETNEILLARTRGKRIDHPRIDRRLAPEGTPFGIEQCKALSAEIDSFNEQIYNLKKEIFDARPTLRKKYEQLFPHQFQNLNYTPLARTHLPQS